MRSCILQHIQLLSNAKQPTIDEKSQMLSGYIVEIFLHTENIISRNAPEVQRNRCRLHSEDNYYSYVTYTTNKATEVQQNPHFAKHSTAGICCVQFPYQLQQIAVLFTAKIFAV